MSFSSTCKGCFPYRKRTFAKTGSSWHQMFVCSYKLHLLRDARGLFECFGRELDFNFFFLFLADNQDSHWSGMFTGQWLRDVTSRQFSDCSGCQSVQRPCPGLL